MNPKKIKNALEYVKNIIKRAKTQKEAGARVKEFFNFLRSNEKSWTKNLKSIEAIVKDMLKNFKTIENYDCDKAIMKAQKTNKQERKADQEEDEEDDAYIDHRWHRKYYAQEEDEEEDDASIYHRWHRKYYAPGEGDCSNIPPMGSACD